MDPHKNTASPRNVDGVPPTLSVAVTPPEPQASFAMTAEGKRKKVGFTSDTTPPSPDVATASASQRYFGDFVHSPEDRLPELSSISNDRFESVIASEIPEISEDARRDIFQAFGKEHLLQPKPAKAALRKSFHSGDIELGEFLDEKLDPEAKERQLSGKDAHERASRLAAKVGSYHASAAPSRNGSVDLDRGKIRSPREYAEEEEEHRRRSSQDSDDEMLYKKRPRARGNSIAEAHDEADRLVRTYSRRQIPSQYDIEDSPLHSGQQTPVTDQQIAEVYVPKPSRYRGGVLASLIKLAGTQHRDGTTSPLSLLRHGHARSADDISLAGTTPLQTPAHSPPASGTTTPTYGKQRKHRSSYWPHSRSGSDSPGSLAALAGSSLNVAYPSKEVGETTAERTKQMRPQRSDMGRRTRSSEAISHAWKKIHPRQQEEIRITKHIAQTIARHKYIVKLCKALMDYGAPTHRLEEYLKMSSRVLEIDAQFLYIPGCMLISFDDPTTHTTEVKLVRTPQGVDLGRLRDTHQIYKEVVHDQIDVVDAMKRLEKVMDRGPKFSVWFRILMFGVAAASVGPFAFEARLIDLPIAFGLGCLVGWLQLVVSPRSDLYANVFEITAAIATSFLARAFGSIQRSNGERYFCFSALAQSSIALILPGYTVLCASLELQSRSIVAGSVRMVYAIIYSLFLGYGITIGTVIYGWIDSNATSATTCHNPTPDYWFFFFVPVFTLCLLIINGAKWKQAPAMLVIAFSGYLVNFFCGRRFRGNAQVTQTLGALTIGLEANLYARLGPTCENIFMRWWTGKVRPRLLSRKQRLLDSTLRRLSTAEAGLSSAEKEKAKAGTWLERKGYGMAAAAMLPAIFVQVPSGLAVSGSLVAGITSADQIISNSTGTTTVSSGSDATSTNGAAFTVSLSVIQIAIGITVGLFMSAVLVYPFGKRRSGLFSF